MNRGLHRFAASTAAATLGLIVAGALVTSNDAGLSVPDWPLSYGSWMPPMVGGIFYEHGHRMIAASVGFLTIILAVWLSRRDPRAWVRRLGWAALAAVIAQGVLGGLTVLYLLPVPVSVAHAGLAQLFFCIVVSLALVTSPAWLESGEPGTAPADSGSPSLRRLCVGVNVLIFAQLILGAAFRHQGLGIAPHLIGAAAVAAGVFWVLARVTGGFADQRRILRTALGLNAVVMLQLVLGGAAYWIREVTRDAAQPLPPMVALTVLHVGLGAVVLALSVVLTFRVFRLVRPDSADMNTEERLPAVI